MPQVLTGRLNYLHRLVQARAFQRSLSGDPPVIPEQQDVDADHVEQDAERQSEQQRMLELELQLASY